MPGEPSQELLGALKRELQQGEELVWSGVPDWGRAKRRIDKVRNAGFVWIALVVAWILGVGVYSNTYPDTEINTLIRVSMAPLGSLVFWWPTTFQRARNMKLETETIVYGLTNSRILIASNVGTRQQKVISYGTKDLQEIVAYEDDEMIGSVFSGDPRTGPSRLLFIEMRHAVATGDLIARTLKLDNVTGPFARAPTD